MGPIALVLHTHRLQSHTTPCWGCRESVFVTEAGWYGVDVDTVRGVTLGLTAGTGEWPLVTGTGHRVTDASYVWAASTEQEYNRFSPPPPCDSFHLHCIAFMQNQSKSNRRSKKTIPSTHHVFVKCNSA